MGCDLFAREGARSWWCDVGFGGTVWCGVVWRCVALRGAVLDTVGLGWN